MSEKGVSVCSGERATWTARDIDRLLQHARESATASTADDVFYRTLLDDAAAILQARAATLWTSEPWRVAKAFDPSRLIGTLSTQDLADEATRLSQLDLECKANLSLALAGKLAHCAALASPCKLRDATAGVLVYYLPQDVPPEALAGCLRFVGSLAEVLTKFEQARAADIAVPVQWNWKSYDELVRSLQPEMSVLETAHVAANEARRLLGCDRTFVLLRRSGHYRAVACSSVDSIDRRSRLAQHLERLVSAVAPLRQVWTHAGAISSSIEPEIQSPLETYLDETSACSVAIVPLCCEPTQTDWPIGMLVLENLTERSQSWDSPAMSVIAQHTAQALERNALYRAWPIRLVRSVTGPWTRLLRDWRIPRWLWITAALCAVAAVVLAVPVHFTISADGQLMPVRHQRVFATHDGFLDQIEVSHGDRVTKGQVLASISSPELDLELRRLLGELQTTQEQLASTSAERFQVTGVDTTSIQRASQLTADELVLRQRETSLQAQLELVRRQVAQLQLTSPLDGTVLDWNIEQRLFRRPVQRGQMVAEVADLTGPWILRLNVRDSQAGHVRAARQQQKSDLPVTFVVSQRPERTHRALLVRAELVTQSTGPREPHVRMEATPETMDGIDARPGATVVAKIHCGRRCLGYVWFHEIYEQIRRFVF